MTAPQPPAAPGASADGGTGGQAPTGTQQPQNTPSAPANEPGAQQPKPTKTDLSTLPDDVQKVIADARAEAAKHRTEGQTAKQTADAEKQRVAAVLKALGINADGTDAPADPAALAAAVEQAQSAAWSTAVENQVLRMKDVDADRLLDSRAFVDSLDPFADDDPRSADFKTKLAAHVKEYVGKHTQFKAAPAGPGRSGGDMPGGPGGTPTRPKSLHAAVNKALGGK